MSKSVGRRAALAITLVVGSVAATATATAGVGAERAAVPEVPLDFTIEAPSFDEQLGSKPLTSRAGSGVDIESSGPLIIASSITGRLKGSDAAYTFEVLDSRSSIDEIVKIDSLEPLNDSTYWATFSDKRVSATQIVGDVDGVLFSLIVEGELTAREAEALVADMSVEETK